MWENQEIDTQNTRIPNVDAGPSLNQHSVSRLLSKAEFSAQLPQVNSRGFIKFDDP